MPIIKMAPHLMFRCQMTCCALFLMTAISSPSLAFLVYYPPSPASAGLSPLSTVAQPSTTRSTSIETTTFFSSNRYDSHEFDDFADYSQSTPSASSPSKLNKNNDDSVQNDDDDAFQASLQSRVQQVQDNSNTLPLMILDTMLPRQILQIQIEHPTLKALMKHRVRMETPTLGMLGMARLSTGVMVPLRTGVEVEIIQMEKADDSSTVIPRTTSYKSPDNSIVDNGQPWDISLRAIRRFTIEGDVKKTEEGWTMATIQFQDSTSEEENEIKQFSETSMEKEKSFDGNTTPATTTTSVTSGDRLSLARAISKCRQFTEPNMNMKDHASLIDRWIQLARQNERHPGQIDTLLQQLGTIPPEHEPTERALWVGALINPLPSLGVAMEIRPALLVSKRAEERVQIALDGILRSIRHMDGSARMW